MRTLIHCQAISSRYYVWHVITEIAMEKPLQLAMEELLRTWLLVFVKFGNASI